ncbi:DUF6884 domain-containing protein [Spirillospora sp. NPDC050679]
MDQATGAPDLVLVGCVKDKADRPVPVRDLYLGALWGYRRARAERAGRPWFVLSGRWGLVHPDEVIAPYDTDLTVQPVAYRRAWGAFVVQRLLLHGPLAGRHVEIHAGKAYVDPVRAGLEELGATVSAPVAGMGLGESLAWYKQQAAGPVDDESVHGAGEGSELGIDAIAARLADPAAPLSIPEYRASDKRPLTSPGVYGLWVDESGAQDLAAGLGLPLEPGLLYVGEAGATKQPEGKRSANTLAARLDDVLVTGRGGSATFRRSIAAVLREPLGLAHEDDPLLAEWMTGHVSVVPVPHADAEGLGLLIDRLVARLDPPLNIKAGVVGPSKVRARIRALRNTDKANFRR